MPIPPQGKSSSNDIPAPDPKKPWALNHNDRWFLRSIKIDPESEKTPYPDEKDDGA